MRSQYVEVRVPRDLLPDVVREILSFAIDPNHVEVVHGDIGQVIMVHPELAEVWYQARQHAEVVPEEPAAEEPAPEPEPEPESVAAPESPKVTETSPSPRKRSTPSA